MTEVVRADLELEAVGSLSVRHHHDAGVIDEHVERAAPRRRESANRCKVGELQLPHLRLTSGAARDLLALGHVSHSKDDPGTRLRELRGRRHTDAARRAGHHHGLPVEVGDVGSGPPVRCHPITLRAGDCRVQYGPHVSCIAGGTAAVSECVCGCGPTRLVRSFKLRLSETAECIPNPTHFVVPASGTTEPHASSTI